MYSQPIAKWTVTCLSLASFCFACSIAIAQDSDKPKQDQTKIVRAIFDATKKTKTESEYTSFLKQCDDALAIELSKANHDYVVSLKGWALSRRGEKRLELAQQLKKIGNNRAEDSMKNAMADFDQAILSDAKRVRSWKSRGIAHVANEDWDSAIRDFAEVTKLSADDPDGWFNRGEALFHRGNFEYALKDYEVALRLNSDDLQSLTGRGLCQLELGNAKDALIDFDRVISVQPESDAAHINRGDAYQKLQQWDKAKSCYEKAISINETQTACQRSAWLLATCPDETIRNSQAARLMIDRTIELGGKTPATLNTLAAVEAAEGDFKSAQATQREVIKLVNAEEPEDDSDFKVRLMMYEKNEPFIQK